MQSEHILLEEDTMKYRIPPPFPQALRGKKKETQQAGILEVLRQVKVNIPLLDLINQVPAYAKFLKDLCTIKRGLGIEKKAFLTEHVSALIQSKYPVKYKDPGSPTIPVNIGGSCINKALLDLGASVNLMPFSVYMQLGLGELKPTSITLSLADRSVKIPKGIVEDVLVKIDKFYYPVDFVVLDTAPSSNEPNHVPIILGRPFLATANAIINCRNGLMQLTFGDMTLELNIFNLNDNLKLLEPENPITNEVVSIDQCAGKTSAQEKQGVISLGDEGKLVLPTTPTVSQLLESTTIPEEPGIEMRDRCLHIVSVDRVMTMPVHFHIRQRDREEVPGEEAEDAHRDDPPAPAPEVQRSPTPVSGRSPPSPPHTTSAAVHTDTPRPSYSAHQSPEHTHVSSREMAGMMDAICTLAATQAAQHAAQDQRLGRAGATLGQCHSMLHQIMTHLGLPHDPAQREEPATDAASLDVLAAAAVASPPPQQ